MKHRSVLIGVAAATVFALVAGCTGDESSSESPSADGESTASGDTDSGSLVFDQDGYTVQTMTVSTDDGDVEVTYHFWEAITYVANPVDADYQSLTVSVPVEIDGEAVDATDAPILLNLNIGGYTSSSVTGASTGMPGGGAPPSGEAPGEAPTDLPEGGTPPSGEAPGEAPGSGETGVESGSGAMVGGGQLVSNGDLALAAGYVVVSPGARGRDNVAEDGTYYGKAPAAIVDLKAAVRYVRSNDGVIPGNTDWIVTSGSSAGGGLSALLGASADSPLYDAYLEEIGAADASDAVFAVGSYCPITDLEHADMAYEWMFGAVASRSGELVDQTLSGELSTAFAEYQASLGLEGLDGFGEITADNDGDYLVQTYLQPAATADLAALSEADRDSYLTENPWITWADGQATFTWADFLEHVGRSKSVPAFDALDLSAAENILFGDETTDARHFTLFSLSQSAGEDAELDADLPEIIAMMNPMSFIAQQNSARATHWWFRVGTSDTDTSLTVVGNLAAGLENLGDDVNASMYWDGGHGANEDAAEFIAWIGEITGYTAG